MNILMKVKPNYNAFYTDLLAEFVLIVEYILLLLLIIMFYKYVH